MSLPRPTLLEITLAKDIANTTTNPLNGQSSSGPVLPTPRVLPAPHKGESISDTSLDYSRHSRANSAPTTPTTPPTGDATETLSEWGSATTPNFSPFRPLPTIPPSPENKAKKRQEERERKEQERPLVAAASTNSSSAALSIICQKPESTIFYPLTKYEKEQERQAAIALREIQKELAHYTRGEIVASSIFAFWLGGSVASTCYLFSSRLTSNPLLLYPLAATNALNVFALSFKSNFEKTIFIKRFIESRLSKEDKQSYNKLKTLKLLLTIIPSAYPTIRAGSDAFSEISFDLTWFICVGRFLSANGTNGSFFTNSQHKAELAGKQKKHPLFFVLTKGLERISLLAKQEDSTAFIKFTAEFINSTQSLIQADRPVQDAEILRSAIQQIINLLRKPENTQTEEQRQNTAASHYWPMAKNVLSSVFGGITAIVNIATALKSVELLGLPPITNPFSPQLWADWGTTTVAAYLATAAGRANLAINEESAKKFLDALTTRPDRFTLPIAVIAVGGGAGAAGSNYTYPLTSWAPFNHTIAISSFFISTGINSVALRGLLDIYRNRGNERILFEALKAYKDLNDHYQKYKNKAGLVEVLATYVQSWYQNLLKAANEADNVDENIVSGILTRDLEIQIRVTASRYGFHTPPTSRESVEENAEEALAVAKITRKYSPSGATP